MTFSHKDHPADRVAPALLPEPAGMTQIQAKGLVLLAALAWGLGNVSQKTILDHLDAYTANGVTCLVGAAILYPFARREGRQTLRPGRGALPLLLQTVFAFTVAATLMQVGYGQTTVTNAGFLVNTAAVLTPILAWVVFRQRSPFLIWPAGFCALLGIFLMGGGKMTTLVSGDVVSLVAALFFAIWTLLVGRYVMRFRRPVILTMVQLSICGSACILLGAAAHGLPTQTALVAALPEILVIGGMSKGFAYVLFARAQEHVTPSCAAILVSAESIFGAAMAMLLLAETPGVIRLLGGGFIVVAMLLAAYTPAKVEIACSRA
jgi:drug/metabolite transporter (DMT)-like permease